MASATADSDRPLEGRVAVVAGATRGAGRGIARMLGAAGAFVYCTGRSVRGAPSAMGRPETIEETAEMIVAAGGRAIAVRVDHTRADEVAALAARVREESGRLDVLVNDIWGGDPMLDWSKRFWELDLDRLEAFVAQTVLSHVVTSRHLAPMMIEADRGLIVEVMDGRHQGYRGQLLYDLAKASVVRLAYAMAMELARTKVTALAITPGFLRSEAVLDHFGVTEESWRGAIAKDEYFAESESPAFVGRAVAALAADAKVKRKAGLALYAGDLAKEYGFTDLDGRTPHFHRLFERRVGEIAAAPGPLDDTSRFLVWARYCQIHRDPAHRAEAERLAARLGLENAGAGVGPAPPP
jgi:NAD(P)-dependent dehydrogenase (short-subunit alcohol dehydrogenase family)